MVCENRRLSTTACKNGELSTSCFVRLSIKFVCHAKMVD